MIITKLQGGLGNQMFQYTLGRELSLKRGAVLKLDISHYRNNEFRSYELSKFNITENIATDAEVKKYYNNFNKILDSLKSFTNKRIIVEKGHKFDKKILLLNDKVYLDGYWNSEKYFKDIEPVIRKEFTLKDKLNEEAQKILAMIRENNSVSLHIRRSDYLTEKISKIFEIGSLEYYTRAINEINERVAQPYFFIFSDDIDWAKNNLTIAQPHFFVSNEKIKDYEEINLMSNCQHNIIANSTFSWWGAWLNNNSKKIVIAPQAWFKNNLEESKDIIPSTWTRI